MKDIEVSSIYPHETRAKRFSAYRSYLRAVRSIVKWELVGRGIVTKGTTMRQEEMFRVFSRIAGVERLGGEDTRESLIRVYREGSNPLLSQKDNFYMSKPWLNLRKQVLRMYGTACMKCGSDNNPHVDHIKPRSKYRELELDLTNLQVLCQKCNIRKSNREEIDYRPCI